MMSGDGENDFGVTQFETLIENALPAGSAEDSKFWQQLQLERFEIQRELGRGGMGLVFLARQTRPIERQVALKLVRRRLLNSENLARFEIERQALARMQHPHIAQVYDAGTTPEGHPWFAMEYVDGVPLDRFCSEHSLNMDERLQLFMRICQGVQHAHQKGIIHCDLKPANILVSRIDGLALPKIIDFGIAAGIDQQAGQQRGLRIGTPQYMSPEQFRDTQAVIDTRSDVYALGVILCELLVGQVPIPRSSFSAHATLSEMATAFQHRQRRPSELLSRSATRQEVALQRSTTLRRLRRRLKNDLDAVALKALALEPDDRYASAGDLAADIDRALHHEPVSAVPSRPSYRARKFIRRHALALGSASAIVLALIAGLTAATVGMFEAQRQFQRAEQRQQELEQVTGFQQAMLEQIDPQSMGAGILQEIRRQWQSGLEREQLDARFAEEALTAASQYVNSTDLARQVLSQHILERATESVERDFVGQSGLQAELYSAIHAVYRAINLPEKLPDLAQRVVHHRRETAGPAAVSTLEAELDLAWAYYLVNDLVQAETDLSAILNRLDGSNPQHREIMIRANGDLGAVLVDQGRLQDALALSSETAALARDWFGPDHILAIQTTSTAGFVHARARNIEQGLLYFEQALAGMRNSLEPDDPRIGRAMLNVASALGQLGRQAEALEIDEELVAFLSASQGRRSPATLRAMSNMANNLAAVGRVDESVRLLIETSELSSEALGADNPQTLRVRLNLGSILARQGQREQGQAILEEVVEQRLKLLGPEHQETLGAQEVLANIMLDRGDYAAAIALLERVVARRLELFGAEHSQTMVARRLLGRGLVATGQYAAAEAHTQSALQHFVERLGPDHNLTLATALDLFRIHRAMGQIEAAQTILSGHLQTLIDAETVVPEHATLAQELAEELASG